MGACLYSVEMGEYPQAGWGKCPRKINEVMSIKWEG